MMAGEGQALGHLLEPALSHLVMASVSDGAAAAAAAARSGQWTVSSHRVSGLRALLALLARQHLNAVSNTQSPSASECYVTYTVCSKVKQPVGGLLL
jgi:hypothetical protein